MERDYSGHEKALFGCGGIPEAGLKKSIYIPAGLAYSFSHHSKHFQMDGRVAGRHTTG
jgi:hypothetical protein